MIAGAIYLPHGQERPPRPQLSSGAATGTLILKAHLADGMHVVSIDLVNLQVHRLPDDVWLCARDGQWTITSGARTAGGGPAVVTGNGRWELKLPSASGRLLGSTQLRAGAVLADDLVGFLIPPATEEDGLQFGVINVLDRTTEVYPWSGPFFVDYCGDADRVFYATRDREIRCLTLGEPGTVHLTNGAMPALSLEGDLAYLSGDRHTILVLPQGAKSASVVGRSDAVVASVEWSPDGRWLAYQYGLGMFNIQSRTEDVFGVGLLEIASGQHYALIPGIFSGTELRGAERSGTIQWISALPDELIGDGQWLTFERP